MVDIYNQFKDFKSFEVTFTNKEEELQKIYCTMKNIENNNIIISANNKKNHNIFASVNDELKLYIFTENGIYSATSKIIEVDKGITSTRYVISYPSNTKHSQRREYFRADMAVKFNIEITPKDETEQSILIENRTKNICGKGMSYISNKPFPEYSSIQVNLLFNDKLITTEANLVYSKQLIVGSKPRFTHAFAFTTIATKDIDLIVKKCFLHQLDLRKQLKARLD